MRWQKSKQRFFRSKKRLQEPEEGLECTQIWNLVLTMRLKRFKQEYTRKKAKKDGGIKIQMSMIFQHMLKIANQN